MGEKLRSARHQLQSIGERISADPEVVARLLYPKETLCATLPVRMDDGTLRLFKGYRCRYDDTRGPSKGGVRFHPQSSLDETIRLAFWMTFKCAVAGLPFGGGKGGVCVDTGELSLSERERLTRSYVRAFGKLLGADRDIAAPDLYSDEMTLAWMLKEHQVMTGRHEPHFVTGKPVALGGSEGRTEATGFGGAHVLGALTARLAITPRKTRVAIQGFGNAGRHCAIALHEAGYRIVAVADSGGGLYASEGLDPSALAEHKRKTGSVRGGPSQGGSSSVSPESILTCDCDLLVPAALGDQITAGNAPEIAAGCILEIANGPTTKEADAILADREVAVIPDILANAGGVIVSHMEWAQNKAGQSWSRETILENLRQKLESETKTVCSIQDDHGGTLREAAYIHGLQRICDSVSAGGTASDFAG